MMKIALFGAVLLLIAFVQSCGQTEQQEEFEQTGSDGATFVPAGSSQPTRTVSSSDRKQKLVAIPVSFKERGEPTPLSFSLASASTYTITLDSCESGFTSSANQGSTNLQVYKFDRGCLAKLTTFQYDSETYTPKAGSTFTDWSVGDTATFENGGGLELFVRVVAQLPAQVTGTEAVTYEFYDIDQGATNTSLDGATMGDGHAMTVDGDEAPSFTIKTINYIGMESGTGKGHFEFEMECTENVTGTTPNRQCEDIPMSQISYKLIHDDPATYNGTITYAQAVALFVGGEDTVVDAADGTDEVFDAAEGTFTRGGFTTKTGIANSLLGPGAMHDYLNMLLIFRANVSGNDTFLYFNVDIRDLTLDQD